MKDRPKLKSLNDAELDALLKRAKTPKISAAEAQQFSKQTIKRIRKKDLETQKIGL
jgi:ribosome assembly protein YihI (activator of Der GTPase)